MSKVKANISEIQNFATKIDEQIDELEEIKTLVSGFVDKAQEATNQERTKLTKAIAHANNVISEAQKKVDEIYPYKSADR